MQLTGRFTLRVFSHGSTPHLLEEVMPNRVVASAKFVALIGLTAIAAAHLAACAGSPPGARGQQSVNEYLEVVRSLQIAPVFPPREDVQVGDLYAPPNGDAASRRPAKTALWLARLDVRDALAQHEKKNVQRDPPAAATQPARVASVRAALLPRFDYVGAATAEVAALVPLEMFAAQLGVKATSIRAASVSITASSTYGLPAVDAWREFCTQYCPGGKLDQNLAAVWPKGHRVSLLIEIYMASAVEFTVSMNSQSRATVDLGAAPGTPPTKAPVPVTAATPAGRLSVLGEDGSVLYARQDLDRPLVVGVRYLTLEHNADGTVTTVAGDPLPAAMFADPSLIGSVSVASVTKPITPRQPDVHAPAKGPDVAHQPRPDPLGPDAAAMMAASRPGREHELLLSLLGAWRWEMTTLVEPGSEPMRSSGESVFTSLFDGRFIREDISADMQGFPFNAITLLGYDRTANKYQSLMFDNAGTAMYVLAGELAEPNNRISWAGEMADPITKQTVRYTAESRWIDKDHFVYTMSIPGPKARTEVEVKYTRKAK